MAQTGLVYHEDYLLHKPSALHPESPRRLEVIMSQLEQTGTLDDVHRLSATPIDPEYLMEVHSAGYVRRVQEVCEGGGTVLDGIDTEICQRSYEVALLAAGGVVEAAQAVADGDVDNAFCAVRPPGHHAIRDRALGFCLFNNIAVAARYLQKEHGIDKVLIVDWDLHHGNGTQAAFYEDDSVVYFSTHQYPYYPGTGASVEKGSGKGEGYTVNVPLPSGSGDKEYMDAFENQLIPAAEIFRPQFMLVSAGFDAHAQDPLGGMLVSDEGFQQLSRMIVDLAGSLCDDRLVSVLEGGYALDALARCVDIHIRVLLGKL